MNKVAAAFVSIGVILVIVGLVIVGIFGSTYNWDDLFNGTRHDLSKANGGTDLTPDQIDGLLNIDIQTDRYSVYVLPADNETLSVKYVDPIEEKVTIGVHYENGKLTVTETDSIKVSTGLFNKENAVRFIVVYIPQNDLLSNVNVEVKTDVGVISVKQIKCCNLSATTDTGAVSLSDIENDILSVKTDTGAVSIKKVNCNNIGVKAETGAINVDATTVKDIADIDVDTGAVHCNITANTLIIDTDTGAINFNVTANNITLSSDTGAISGKVIGNKADYEIRVTKDVGSSQLKNQHVENATKFLTVKVDTGSINVKFSNK
ncbi:MAG: DUF4097 domain-containing protein [Clostridia bacterium]|nr:DUF4097 domain-containing protein [Clostridia bacterium]